MAGAFHCGVVAMNDNNKHTDLEDRLAGDLPFEAFQETLPADVADRIRFLQRELEARVALRDRAVESLLQQECEIETRLHEIVRPYGPADEMHDKERVQLKQEVRNIEKQRREVYEAAASELLQIKHDLVDALLEYRVLRRRQRAFGRLLDDRERPRDKPGASAAGYVLPPLPQYLATAPDNTPPKEKKSDGGDSGHGDQHRAD